MKKNLDDWLRWQETLHLSEIDLGLERIAKVASKLNLRNTSFPIITVAGTNGKGSTVAFLDAILRAASYKTGAFTSPHLVDYNERIVLDGKQASDETIIQAFVAIDNARRNIANELGEQEDISLTYFEFSTLAAIYIYEKQKVDVAILEVGLGGRLDAANLWDASLAIITSIGIDHIDWLGNDREIIAVEKSGIMRPDTPVICGDIDAPKSIASEAQGIKASLQQINTDFSFKTPKSNTNTWIWKNKKMTLELDVPTMSGEFQLNNAATAIAALLSVDDLFQVSIDNINQGLKSATVMGRLQILKKNPEWLIDVAHNPHAAKQLAKYIKQNSVKGKTYAIFSMLRDKDVAAVLNIMYEHIDEWHIVATQGSRGLTLAGLKQHFQAFENTSSKKQKSEQNTTFKTLNPVKYHSSFKQACASLKNITKDEDRVVAFGSFLVISEILNNCN